jgi:hypothetical protein
MKYENLIYALGAILVIAGAVLKILHLPLGNTILFSGFLATSLFQNWQVAKLKERIKELESNS